MAIAPVLKTGARKGLGVRIPRAPLDLRPRSRGAVVVWAIQRANAILAPATSQRALQFRPEACRARAVARQQVSRRTMLVVHERVQQFDHANPSAATRRRVCDRPLYRRLRLGIERELR